MLGCNDTLPPSKKASCTRPLLVSILSPSLNTKFFKAGTALLSACLMITSPDVKVTVPAGDANTTGDANINSAEQASAIKMLPLIKPVFFKKILFIIACP